MVSRRNVLGAMGSAAIGALIEGCGAKGSEEPAPPVVEAHSLVRAEPSPSTSIPDHHDMKTSEPASAKEWLLGSYLSLSKGQFGMETKQGILCGLSRVNQKPPRGIPMRMIFEDEQDSVDEAARCVKKLVDEDHVLAIVGSVKSSIARAGGVVANAKHVPMIATGATHPSVTQVGPYVFRICFVDPQQGTLAAEYILKTLGKKRIGLLYASDEPYSSTVADAFGNAVASLGAKLAARVSFLSADTKFDSQLRALKAANVDVVFAPAFYTPVSLIAPQAKKMGIPLTSFIGGDGWVHPGTFDALEGARFMDHFAADAPWPASRKFVEAYTAQFGYGPTSQSAMGYDAICLIADAILRAADPTPDGIRDALASTKDFLGATGLITMDEHRDPLKVAIIQRIENGVAFYDSVIGPGAESLVQK